MNVFERKESAHKVTLTDKFGLKADTELIFSTERRSGHYSYEIGCEFFGNLIKGKPVYSYQITDDIDEELRKCMEKAFASSCEKLYKRYKIVLVENDRGETLWRRLDMREIMEKMAGLL